jgi:hypothetical protein
LPSAFFPSVLATEVSVAGLGRIAAIAVSFLFEKSE